MYIFIFLSFFILAKLGSYKVQLYDSSREAIIPEDSEFFSVCKNDSLGIYGTRELDPIGTYQAFLIKGSDESVLKKIYLAMCLDDDSNKTFIETKTKYIEKDATKIRKCKNLGKILKVLKNYI